MLAQFDALVQPPPPPSAGPQQQPSAHWLEVRQGQPSGRPVAPRHAPGETGWACAVADPSVRIKGVAHATVAAPLMKRRRSKPVEVSRSSMSPSLVHQAQPAKVGKIEFPSEGITRVTLWEFLPAKKTTIFLRRVRIV